MKSRLNLVGWILSVSVLVCGVASYLVRAYSGDIQSEPRSSFVVEYNQYIRKNAGPPELIQRMERAVSADGDWKQTTYDMGGKVVKIVGADSIASYKVKDGYLQYGDSNERLYNLNREAYSEGFFRKHPAFVREDVVAGIATYVLKSDDGGNGWTEDFYSPKTGMTPLKTVELDNHSGEMRIKEAINIQFRALREDEYRLPHLDVRFDDAEQLIRILQEDKSEDNRKAAEAMVARLENVKRKLAHK